MRKIFKSISVGSVVIAGVIFAILARSNSTNVAASNAISIADAVGSTSKNEPAAAAVVLPQLRPLIASSSKFDLNESYGNITSGRKFYELALAHPEKGGYSYIKNLLGHCFVLAERNADADVTSIPAEEDGAAYAIKQRALEQFRRKCDSFANEELGLNGTLAKALGDDAFDQAQRGLRENRNKNDEQERRALAAVLSTADPLLIDEVGIRLSRSAADDPSSVYFDGEKFALNSDVLAAAYYLAPCNIGLKCTIDQDEGLATRCITGGQCFQDRGAYALEVLLQGSQDKLQKANQLASQISEAILGDDTGKFFPPPK